MSDDEARPTRPFAETHSMIELPVSQVMASQLAQSLFDYAKVCVAVKKAIELSEQDDGKAYRDAREVKQAHYNFALSAFDRVLAHIGVHAR